MTSIYQQQRAKNAMRLRSAVLALSSLTMTVALAACNPTPTNSNHSGPGHENSTTSIVHHKN